MASPIPRRRIALPALGAAVLAAALAPYLLEERGSQRPAAAAAQARAADPQAQARAGAPQRERQSGEVLGEPFGAREPAPPGARPAAAPPAPPPAFPYRYGGQVAYGDGRTRVYLARDNRLFAIERDDVLEGGFKVVAISADALRVIHLPSGEALQVQYSSLGGRPGADPAAASPEPLGPKPGHQARAMLRSLR